MKQNELTIEIPNNKVVDWEESKKQNKIVLKDKQLTYKEICNKLFKGGLYYSTDTAGKIHLTNYAQCWTDSNNATTAHQLECILAKNKLANVAMYLNDGWEPDRTNKWHFNAWVLFITPNKDYIGWSKIDNCASNSNVLFKSKELALQAIEILGKETIKLALEPLGF